MGASSETSPTSPDRPTSGRAELPITGDPVILRREENEFCILRELTTDELGSLIFDPVSSTPLKHPTNETPVGTATGLLDDIGI